MKIIIFSLSYIILTLTGSYAGIGIKQARDVGPVCPAEDPLLRVEEAPLDIMLHPILEIHEGNTRSDLTIRGLSSFKYEYTIYLTSLFIDFQVTLGSLELTSMYNATGYLDMNPIAGSCIPSGNFTGDGRAVVTVENLRVTGYTYLRVNSTTSLVSIGTFQLYELSFGTLNADLGPNFRMNGNPIDWMEFNMNIKRCFDSEMDADNNAVVFIIKMGRTINEVIKGYTFDEFIDIIEGDPTECEES